MRVLVVGHRLELGGSQTNTVQLAAAIARRGHDVHLAAADGPARRLVEEAGVPWRPLPEEPRHPSRRVARCVSSLVRELRPHLVHAWEWPQVLDVSWGPHRRLGVPLLATSMSMVVLRTLPRHVPLTVGTEALVTATRRTRPGVVHLLEPPVDLVADDPAAVDADAFRATAGLDREALHVVVVSRLAEPIKTSGIDQAIDALAFLPADPPVRLVVVGDGPERPRLERRAQELERRLGRAAVRFLGALADPRPAYAAADIVVANGSSALRGLAFARPTIVYGDRAFSEIVTPESAPRFTAEGYYGAGDGTDRLPDQLAALVLDPARRAELGSWGRGFVAGRYGLDAVTDRLEAIYREVGGSPVPPRWVRELDAVRLRVRAAAGSWRRRARCGPRFRLTGPAPTARSTRSPGGARARAGAGGPPR